MNRNITLDKKIVALQKAVQSLKENRDDLAKELAMVKARTQQKQSV